MQQFYKSPFFFLTVFLVIGILLSGYLEHWVGIVFVFSGITGIVFFKTRVTIIGSLLFAFGCGIMSSQIHRNDLIDSPKAIESSIFRAIVLEKKEFSNSDQLLVQVCDHDYKELINRKVLISSKSFKEYFAGDVLLINSELNLMKEPSVPGQFSFKEYYANKGIYWQTYLADSYLFRKVDTHKNWNYYLQRIRSYLANNLEKSLGNSPEEAVLRALIIGDKSHLTPEVKESYTTAGIIHVLAVSGLHVGFFYLILMAFVKRIPNQWIQVFCLVLGLSFYAGLTGFSPSVIRASFMFFFFGCAQIINRNTKSIHVLFASTFFILLVKPNFIFEPGFQLSFVAVLGILIGFNPLNNLLTSKYWLVNKIWSGLSVSLVAQVFTAPLILYYFHQLPVYFLFTNLIVVIIVQFALISGVLISVFGDLPVVTFVAKNSVGVIQKIADWSNQLPYPKITGFYVNQIQVVFLYLLIASFLLFWIKKRRGYAFMSVLSGIFVIAIAFNRMIEHKDLNRLSFHKVKNELVIERTHGKSIHFFTLNDTLNKGRVVKVFDNYFSRINTTSVNFHELTEPMIIKGKSFGIVRESNELYFDYNVCLYRKKFRVINKAGEQLFSSYSTKSLEIIE